MSHKAHICLLFCFWLFVNDISVIFRSNHLFFADDLKVFISIRSPHDAEVLQEELSFIREWCINNDMEFSAPKCKAVCSSSKICPYQQPTAWEPFLWRWLRLLEIWELFSTLNCRLLFSLMRLPRRLNYCSVCYIIIRQSRRDFKTSLYRLYYSLTFRVLSRPRIILSTQIDWNEFQEILKNF